MMNFYVDDHTLIHDKQAQNLCSNLKMVIVLDQKLFTQGHVWSALLILQIKRNLCLQLHFRSQCEIYFCGRSHQFSKISLYISGLQKDL